MNNTDGSLEPLPGNRSVGSWLSLTWGPDQQERGTWHWLFHFLFLEKMLLCPFLRKSHLTTQPELSYSSVVCGDRCGSRRWGWAGWRVSEGKHTAKILITPLDFPALYLQVFVSSPSPFSFFSFLYLLRLNTLAPFFFSFFFSSHRKWGHFSSTNCTFDQEIGPKISKSSVLAVQ